MEHATIRKKQQGIHELLASKRLKEALELIGSALKDTQNSELIDMHYGLETTYKNLLHYTIEGFADPERQKIYMRLVADLFKLTDDIFLDLYTKFGKGPFWEIRREHESINPARFGNMVSRLLMGLEEYQLNLNPGEPYGERIEGSLSNLFETLLVNANVYKNQELVEEMFASPLIPWERKCVMVSAVTLHLLNYFNSRALKVLFNLANQENQQVRLRAVVGLMLVLYKHDHRLHIETSIKDQLEYLKQAIGAEIIETIVIQIVRTRETEKLERKITDELLPEVARIHPNVKNRFDLENILNESAGEDKNPDWEDLLAGSPGLVSKLEEFSKLQMEGADLFLATFRMLKHFSFFQRAENWFLPFSYPGPVVNDILKNEPAPFNSPSLLSALAESGVICNSDKHSLVLSIPGMPQIQKKMMGHMFIAEMESGVEIAKSEELVQKYKKPLSVTNLYIQDLYRFFRIHPRRREFEDPFAWQLDFHNRWFIKELFPGGDFLMKLGDYLFEKDNFAEALEVFSIISSKNAPSMQLLQKQAYCLQQLNQTDKALEFYLQANLFNHEQLWNLKKIAFCYKTLKKYDKALEYYMEVERVAPDNLQNQANIGHCLVEIKNYNEALKYYFKVEYLDPSNKRVWKPISWCCLILGKFDTAEKYCEKTLENDPNLHDYMYMGHIKWCQGVRHEALKYYQKSIANKGYSIREFFEAFENDRHILISHGVDENDIPIMLDQLRYYLDAV